MERTLNQKQTQNTQITTRLRSIRLDRDLTYDQIASLSGLTASTIYRIEKGLVSPNERTIHKLTQAIPELLNESVS